LGRIKERENIDKSPSLHAADNPAIALVTSFAQGLLDAIVGDDLRFLTRSEKPSGLVLRHTLEG